MHAGVHVLNTLQTINLRWESNLLSTCSKLSCLVGMTLYVTAKLQHRIIVQPFTLSQHMQHSFKPAQVSRLHSTESESSIQVLDMELCRLFNMSAPHSLTQSLFHIPLLANEATEIAVGRIKCFLKV